LAVTVAYGSLLGGFAGELFAFKAGFYAFGVGAVADLAELVFSCHAACRSVGAGAFFTNPNLDAPTLILLDDRTKQAVNIAIEWFRKNIDDPDWQKDKIRRLMRLTRECPNLFDSKTVFEHIKHLKKTNDKVISTGYQGGLIYAYVRFCKENQIPYDKPKVKITYPVPLIPTTNQVERIISQASHEYQVIFRICAETAIEGAELHRISQKMIDTTQGTISVIGCKGHDNGNYKLKATTAELLRAYLATHREEFPFPISKNMHKSWQYFRKITSTKFNDPDLLKIPFKNLRNYAGAIFYNQKGKDTFATMRFMRHKNLKTTQHYLQGMITDQEPDYLTRTVQLGQKDTIKEICALSELGYNKLCEADGYIIFRKVKGLGDY
jgi:integrase